MPQAQTNGKVKTGTNGNKKVKKRHHMVPGNTYLAKAEIERIKLLRATGAGIREICRTIGRSPAAVSKIVRAEERDQKSEETKGKIWGMIEEMLQSVNYAVQNEVDGRLAHTLLRDLGILVEQKRQVQLEVQRSMQPGEIIDIEDKLVDDWSRKLGVLALEKAKVYGGTLPEGLDEKLLKKLANGEKE
jgi:hypothetical protein